MIEMQWTVVHVKPNAEGRALRGLQRKEFIAFCPKYRDRASGRRMLLYPGYVLVGFSPNWHDVFHTDGVLSYLLSDGYPSIVPAKDIERLRALEDEDGFIQLGYHPGQKLRILRGQFNSMLATYKRYNEKRKREVVSVPFLGGEREVELKPGELAAV